MLRMHSGSTSYPISFCLLHTPLKWYLPLSNHAILISRSKFMLKHTELGLKYSQLLSQIQSVLTSDIFSFCFKYSQIFSLDRLNFCLKYTQVFAWNNSYPLASTNQCFLVMQILLVFSRFSFCVKSVLASNTLNFFFEYTPFLPQIRAFHSIQLTLSILYATLTFQS